MPSPDPQELLSHSAWLRGLARSLVHEGADDLVQEAWVAALQSPPRAERGLRPWLRSVVTNAARLRWRGDVNRTARERAVAEHADREVPSADELLERHELQQLLARLVSELREPFRSTILLRFAEGLTPTEIARRLGIPAGTVRWRLKEGLEILRAELDAVHRGNREAWVLALGPLVLPRTAPATPLLPWLVALLAITAAGAIVAILVARRTEPTSASASSSAITTIPSRPGRASVGVDSDAVAWIAQEGAPSRRLTGRVTSNGAPVADAVVRLTSEPLPARELHTDAAGRFDFGEQRAREFDIGASRPGKLAAIRHLDLRDPQESTEIELQLDDCSASIHGRVTDAAGTPIEGAQIMREGVIGARSDRTGSYRLCVVPTAALVAELRLVVHADGFGTLAVPLAAPGHIHHDFVLVPEAAITGRVISASGEPIADARVALDLTGALPPAPPERGVPRSTITDGDGSFRIGGLAAGEYVVVATSAGASAPPVRAAVEAAESHTIELVASPTGIVQGRVIANGRPVAGVTIAAGPERAVSQADGTFVIARVPAGEVTLATTPYKLTSTRVSVAAGQRTIIDLAVTAMAVFQGTVRRHGVPVPFARVDIRGPSMAGVTADASGRYRATGLEPGKYAFYCDDRRRGAMFATDLVVELGASETREYDIDLAWGGTIAGHVVDSRGNSVGGAAVAFDGVGSSVCASDDTGAFTCGGLAGGTYTASVRPGRTGAHPFAFGTTPPPFLLRDGDARIDDVRLVVEPNVTFIAGTVTDHSGAPVADVTVRAFAVTSKARSMFDQQPSSVTDDDGRFRIEPLSRGDYHVEVERGAFATRQTLAAGTSGAVLVLDRGACEGARAHDLPPGLTRPSSPVQWNNQIELVGWSLPPAAVLGQPTELVVAYRAIGPIDRDWRIFGHLDSDTTRVNMDHEPAIGWCPTSGWQPGDVVVDRSLVTFARTGRYTLRIGFFTGSAPDWKNLSLTAVPPPMSSANNAGVILGDVAVR